MSNLEAAIAFLEVCEKGDGWEACKDYCAENATFRSQAGVFHPPQAEEPNLGGTLKNYVDWVEKMNQDVLSNCHVSDVVCVYDEKTSTVIFSAVFNATHTNTPEGVPLPPPTNKSAASDFENRVHFDSDGKIDSLIKIWNSEWTAKQFGWMEFNL